MIDNDIKRVAVVEVAVVVVVVVLMNIESKLCNTCSIIIIMHYKL